MKYLKGFNESLEHTRLSVEDIEDYFLEFIDNGSMEFYYNAIPLIMGPNKEIHTTFKLSNKFRDIQTVEELNNFTNLINKIGDVVKRWNLNFKFSTIAIGDKPGGGGGPHQTQLTIIQPIPKILIDNFYTQDTITNTTFYRVHLNNLEVKYTQKIEVDHNSDFILCIKVDTHTTGSGQNGKWLKSDYINFKDNENNFIKHFITNDIPCEFISKKQTSDLRYNQPHYDKWYFKLLI